MTTNNAYDVIIVGGGIMGSATAYYLTRADSDLKVAVVERDPLYQRASTTLSMSNARIQFSLRGNVRISQYALDILDHFEEEMAVENNRPHIGYRREGNLFMVNADDQNDARQALEMQQALGCQVNWWDVETVREHYPLFQTENYVGATFGSRDGYFDAYAALMAYRAKARAQGAHYLEDEVTGIGNAAGQVTGVTLKSGAALKTGVVINCAGAWCTELARTAAIELPVQPVKRQVFCVDPADKPEGPLPLTVLPSGLYFRTDTGGTLLIGKSKPEDAVGFDFNWDEGRFNDELWPELWEFVPSFDRLKLIRGWAGLYAVNTFDSNAILGEWPEMGGFYLANGFSGHGLQQAPAVGRYLSELITGKSLSLDLSSFGPERILTGKPLGEDGLV